MSSIPQTILIEETVNAFAISTCTDGIGNIVFVSAEKLSQTTAVKVGIGVDAVWTIHEVADTTEELLVSSEHILRLCFQLFDGLLLFLFALFYLSQQSAVLLKECLVILMRTP